MRGQRILVVDDEDKIRRLLARYLAAEGFHVDEASCGPQALRRVRTDGPDLVLLDVMLPGADGFEVLQQIRAQSNVPVIMLTARTEEVDRLVGLTVGADDYVTKPFSPREVVLRVKAILRRTQAVSSPAGELLAFKELTIDLARREVVRNGVTIDLTALEFDLLAALASSPGRVFTRRQLLERIWGADFFGDERVVDVHVRNLRRALGDNAAEPEVLATVRGVGYKLIAARP